MAVQKTGLLRFLSLINPMGAMRDFRGVWMQENPHRWRFFALAAAVTICIFGTIFGESYRIEPRAPTITYINTFEPGRSDEEIIASNIENQKRKDALRAERAAREEEIRQRYETVARVSGIDVEEARQQGERERAMREAREAEARRRAIERVEKNF
ncbi:hypothetical protein [Croceicoccus hydrothermalis]|uniref:hypothetical protein n=1 Tax=Croceicoccus hydrothermalis TaxID=2867964 RepID=UPI001EFA8A90|nr:hypothetical protein [Croceicoccus hydrothermalis]